MCDCSSDETRGPWRARWAGWWLLAGEASEERCGGAEARRAAAEDGLPDDQASSSTAQTTSCKLQVPSTPSAIHCSTVLPCMTSVCQLLFYTFSFWEYALSWWQHSLKYLLTCNWQDKLLTECVQSCRWLMGADSGSRASTQPSDCHRPAQQESRIHWSR